MGDDETNTFQRNLKNIAERLKKIYRNAHMKWVAENNILIYYVSTLMLSDIDWQYCVGAGEVAERTNACSDVVHVHPAGGGMF